MGDIEDVGDALADELTFDPDVDASGITVRIVPDNSSPGRAVGRPPMPTQVPAAIPLNGR